MNTKCLFLRHVQLSNKIISAVFRRIFIGGSFITSKEYPRDFDCLIVFNQERDIPDFIDSSIIGVGKAAVV